VSQNAFFLEPVPPFRLDLTAWTLRRRPDNATDWWGGATYRRVLAPAGGPVEVAVVQTGPPETPRLRVTVHGAPLRSELKQAVTADLKRLLGLRIDLAAFYCLASHDAELGPLTQRFRGMKPPRFPSMFEAIINSITCQQVTLTLGIYLLNRLAEGHGPVVAGEEGPARAFPRPEDLARLDPEALRGLGLSRQKGRFMIELAWISREEHENLEGLAALSDDEAVARLCGLRGVGRWSAEYFLLRRLRRTHIFPSDDVGARKNLQRWLTLADPLNYDAVHRTLVRWRPYGRADLLSLAARPACGGGAPVMKKQTVKTSSAVYYIRQPGTTGTIRAGGEHRPSGYRLAGADGVVREQGCCRRGKRGFVSGQRRAELDSCDGHRHPPPARKRLTPRGGVR
jgi:DNA-3-methyladenine glycosylase II